MYLTLLGTGCPSVHPERYGPSNLVHNKNTKILVNESGIPSAKTKKAEAEGISIVTNINELLEKNHGST